MKLQNHTVTIQFSDNELTNVCIDAYEVIKWINDNRNIVPTKIQMAASEIYNFICEASTLMIENEEYFEDEDEEEDCDQEDYEEEDCDQEDYEEEDGDQEDYEEEDGDVPSCIKSAKKWVVYEQKNDKQPFTQTFDEEEPSFEVVEQQISSDLKTTLLKDLYDLIVDGDAIDADHPIFEKIADVLEHEELMS